MVEEQQLAPEQVRKITRMPKASLQSALRRELGKRGVRVLYGLEGKSKDELISDLIAELEGRRW